MCPLDLRGLCYELWASGPHTTLRLHLSHLAAGRILHWCSAMGGSVKFEDALEMRLAIMQTSHQNIQDFLAAHPPRISQGDGHLLAVLKACCQP